MLKIVLLLQGLFASSADFSPQDKTGFIGSYLEIKNALIKADAATVQQEADIALKNLKEVPDFSGKETIAKLLKKMSATSDVEKQRAALADISVLLWETIKTDKTVTMKLYYNYCPMKKMYWISEWETVKNPYYGNKMLNCGSVKEIKN